MTLICLFALWTAQLSFITAVVAAVTKRCLSKVMVIPTMISHDDKPESELPLNPTVSQEEEEGETKEDTADDSTLAKPPQKRRRSLRNTNRIVLSDRSSLQYRRLNEFFFQEEEEEEGSTSESNETIQIGSLTLQRVHASPNVYIIDNFLSASELEYLQSKINSGKFERSYCDQVDTENSKSTFDTQHRTSTFLSFSKRQDSRTAAIEQRAADLLGSWTSQSVEPLQLVRYLPGQFFCVHHDMGDLDDDGSVALPNKTPFSKRRLVTIFCYMNAVDEGGSTYFPACGDLRVAPLAGRAVVFANVKSDGLPDPRTVHAGEPVVKGIKYGLNIWLCEE